MRRTLWVFPILLPLGAVINIAVAWLAGLAPDGLTVDSRTDLPPPALVHFVCQQRSSDCDTLLEGRDNYWGLGYAAYNFSRVDHNQMVLESILYLKLGFPFKAVEGAEYYSLPLVRNYWAFDSPVESRNGFVHSLPIRPLWAGLAINTSIYTLVLTIILNRLLALRRRLRLWRGLCPNCLYPIGQSSRCTECGAPVHGRRRSNRKVA
jgi:hypothetical protein